MWPTSIKPNVNVGKEFFRFGDVESDEILSSEISLVIFAQFHQWKIHIWLENSFVFHWFRHVIGLYLKYCSGDLQEIFWVWVTYMLLKHSLKWRTLIENNKDWSSTSVPNMIVFETVWRSKVRYIVIGNNMDWSSTSVPNMIVIEMVWGS